MKIKESKGSIAIYVIVSFIFLTIILISMLAASKNSQIVGLKAQGVIKNVYENDIDNTDEIYSQMKDNDTVAPTVTISTIANSTDYLFAIKAVVTITDNDSGVDFNKCKYVFTTSNEPIGTNIANYTDGSISAESTTIEKAKGSGTYYLHVLATDNKGNSIEKTSTNTVTVASIANYDYTTDTSGNGKEQTAKILPGKYQFECWGAQGGEASNKTGGYGGYSVGEIDLNESKDIYIYVGEKGESIQSDVYGTKFLTKASFNRRRNWSWMGKLSKYTRSRLCWIWRRSNSYCVFCRFIK